MVLKKKLIQSQSTILQVFHPIDFLLLKLLFTVHDPADHDISATRTVVESVRLSVVLCRGNIVQTLCTFTLEPLPFWKLEDFSSGIAHQKKKRRGGKEKKVFTCLQCLRCLKRMATFPLNLLYGF